MNILRIVTFFGLIVTAQARAEAVISNCEQALSGRILEWISGRNMIRPTGILDHAILTESDRAEIAHILNVRRPQAPEFNKVLEIYMEARLRGFSAEERALIIKEFPGITISLEGELTTKATKIVFPISLKDSPIPIIVMAHELEHIIQYIKMGALGEAPPVVSIAKLLHGFMSFRQPYWHEYGAILAEWEILSVLPDHLIDASLQQALAWTISGNVRYQTFKNMLVFAKSHPARLEYLRMVHESGRYSAAAIAREQTAKWTVLGLLGLGGYCLFNIIF